MPRDDISLRPDMYPCSLCWKDNVTLIIGWGASIKVVFHVFIISILIIIAPLREYDFLNNSADEKFSLE